MTSLMPENKRFALRLTPRDYTRVRMASASVGKSTNKWIAEVLAIAALYSLKRGMIASGVVEAEVREALERESEELAGELLRKLGGAPRSGREVALR